MPTGDGYGGCVGLLELTYSGYVAGWTQNDVNNTFNRLGIAPPTIINYPVDGATVGAYSDAESMLDIYCAGGVVAASGPAPASAPCPGGGGGGAVSALPKAAVSDAILFAVIPALRSSLLALRY